MNFGNESRTRGFGMTQRTEFRNLQTSPRKSDYIFDRKKLSNIGEFKLSENSISGTHSIEAKTPRVKRNLLSPIHEKNKTSAQMK